MIKIFLNIVIFILVLNSFSLLGQTSSSNVALLANFDDYHSTGYNDCWGYTAPDGREYALLGVLNGTSIIDITDTDSLNEIAFISSNNSGWKDIKTYQNYAYVVNETGGGLQIIDLSNLPASASLANTYNGISTSHNIYIDKINGILFSEGGASDPVIVISLADPVNPTQLSTLGVECHDIYELNGILYVSEGNNGSIGIYDVSQPGSPSLLHRHFIPSAGYIHNAWATEDGNYLMTTEETSGKTIKLWDISDFNNITLTDGILGPNSLAHNVHIKGNYSYVSHYRDGLRIYDISNPDSIFEAGYYDTYPGSGTQFAGAWGAFPFFQSGKILISDRSTGLYIVSFDATLNGIENNPDLPVRYSISPNFPNPFNPTTTIKFEISKSTEVNLIIYNLLGQEITTLVKNNLQAGSYNVMWNGKSKDGNPVASGIYVYAFRAGSYYKTQKMIMMK